MASPVQDDEPESITLDDALKLLRLPREVGFYEEANAETGEICEGHGRGQQRPVRPLPDQDGADGKSETRSLASEEIFTVDIDKAKELFAQPKYGRGRGRGAAKPPLRELGTDPETGKNVTIKDGRSTARTSPTAKRTVHVPQAVRARSIEPAEAFRPREACVARRRSVAAGPAKGAAGKSQDDVSAAAKRADRRAKVKSWPKGGHMRIAKEIGSTAATVKADRLADRQEDHGQEDRSEVRPVA